MDAITSTTLLDGLREGGNVAAWQRFEERFRPMVFAFARRLGLREPDAQDVAQDTMIAFLEAYRSGQYDRTKGRLRSWLFGIAHRRIMDSLRNRAKEVAITDKTSTRGLLDNIEAPDPAQAIWEREWRRAVLHACVAEVARDVHPETLAAFDLYVLQQWSVERVVEQLGITTNAVYIAKNRVMTRIREIRSRIEEAF